MSNQGTNQTSFEMFLNSHDGEAWTRALEELLPFVHEVDRNALRIWFAFYPLELLRALEQSENRAELESRLLMQGNFYLKQQIDSSHTFLYGHRFWPQAKSVVAERAASHAPTANQPLARVVRDVAALVAARAGVEESLTAGIAAVALMTLVQVGLDELSRAPGRVLIDEKYLRRTPAQILEERSRDDSQGLLGFLRTTDRRWTVTFDEHDPSARFRMVHGQEIASAAPTHPVKDWSTIDPRCTINEGPIPVQCRSASCGTCWVGVLGGAEKLSPVQPRERRVMKLLGYIDTDEAQPLVRLSCQAQGQGAVSIVIPPWNGVFGKYLERLKRGEAGSTQQAAQAEEANA